MTTSENKKIAAEMVEREMKQNVASMHEHGVPTKVVAFEDLSDWPDGDGEGAFIPVTIGVRGNLTKREAREGGAMWREARRRYPEGIFMITLLGYDEDPREICDIPEAARYVRWWARFAGMNDLKMAERYVLDAPDTDVKLNILGGTSPAGALVGLLAACGVYGDEMKAHAVRFLKPVIAQ